MPATRRPAYRRFLHRLRTARLDAGLTQAQVAKRLRRSQAWVSKSESGDRRVDVIELAELSRLYSKRITYFYK